MKDEVVSFNTAKLAKEKGFTTPVTSFSNEYYNELGEYKTVSYNTKIESYEFECPTQSLLQTWLRKTHNIHIIIIPETIIQKRGIYKFYAELIWHKFEEESDENTFFNTYEECLENALKEALELL